jgi:hypothetical protein
MRFKALRRVRLYPWRITAIVAAALVRMYESSCGDLVDPYGVEADVASALIVVFNGRIAGFTDGHSALCALL